LRNILRTKIKSGASSRNRGRKICRRTEEATFLPGILNGPRPHLGRTSVSVTDKGRRLPVISHGVVTSAIRSH